MMRIKERIKIFNLNIDMAQARAFMANNENSEEIESQTILTKPASAEKPLI